MSAIKDRSAIVLLFVAVLGIGFAAAPSASQEPKNDKEPEGAATVDPKFDRNFWDTDPGIGVQATLQCTGGGNVFGALGARMLASEFALLTKWHFEFDKVIPLNPRNLSVIEDGRFLPDVRAKEFKELKLPDRGFYFAYIEGLWRSHLATNEMFAESAKETPDTPYSELASNAPRYRGKIITVKGRLTRLESREAPWLVTNDGIEKVYMGEIHGPNPRVPTYVAVFTDLPEGLKPSPKMDRAITFQGYFLANISFPTDGGKKGIAHPYLVGKTLIVHDAKDKPVEATESYSYTLIISTLGAIVGVVLIGAVLSLWFRRSDQKIRSQLANVRDKHVPFSLEPDTPAAGPIETGIQPGDPPPENSPPPAG